MHLKKNLEVRFSPGGASQLTPGQQWRERQLLHKVEKELGEPELAYIRDLESAYERKAGEHLSILMSEE